MLRADDFTLFQEQASIFTPGANFRLNRLIAHFLGNYQEEFDGEPVVIPIPEGFPVPAETIRFILQSRDGGLRLQASPARLDVVATGENLDASRPLPEFLHWCQRLFDGYVGVAQARV